MNQNDKIFQDLLAEIRTLNANIVELGNIIKESRKPKSQKAKHISQLPALPMTVEEMHVLEDKFNQLYDRWLNGEDMQIQQELELLSTDEVRRLADANNLNVTTKMPKQKILNLISIRFREKKLLTTNLTLTKPLSEAPGSISADQK